MPFIIDFINAPSMIRTWDPMIRSQKFYLWKSVENMFWEFGTHLAHQKKKDIKNDAFLFP